MTTAGEAEQVGLAPVATPTGRRFELTLGAARPFILPGATAFAFLAAWEILVRALAIPTVILPAPTLIIMALIDNLPALAMHAVPTTAEAFGAFLIATALGTAIAFVLTASPLMRDAFYPNMILFQLIPKIALAPLFVIWLGIGPESRLVFATFISFFPIAIATAVGLESTDRDALRLCRSLNASTWQSFVMVRFPFALPHLFSGMKIAVTMSMIGVIVGEFISAKAGLGFYILYASSRSDTPVIFAAILALCIIGLAMFGLVAGSERWVRKWYRG